MPKASSDPMRALPTPDGRDIPTKKPRSRTESQRMWRGDKSTEHRTVGMLLRKMKSEKKKREAHRARVIGRLKKMRESTRLEESVHESDSTDGGRETEELEEELQLREEVGKHWRSRRTVY
ncbi:hypothetical protein C8F04DRAFT_1175222 [Mycena alexandri]|uniref:Uncharacterized protein n=1 Tax=Mycena alexandri TaxID=1745969 RepID=A0AAD6XDP0_9AGAR|nr:hypothetical protein C8F04DRAFT_1175222 [Mycena alexandri]